MLFGCNVAETEAGKDFVEQLGRITGVDVAASNDLTGSRDKGGDVELEVTTGTIEADLGWIKQKVSQLSQVLDAEAIATTSTEASQDQATSTNTKQSQTEASATELTDQESRTNNQTTLISSPEELTITPEINTVINGGSNSTGQEESTASDLAEITVETEEDSAGSAENIETVEEDGGSFNDTEANAAEEIPAQQDLIGQGTSLSQESSTEEDTNSENNNLLGQDENGIDKAAINQGEENKSTNEVIGESGIQLSIQGIDTVTEATNQEIEDALREIDTILKEKISGETGNDLVNEVFGKEQQADNTIETIEAKFDLNDLNLNLQVRSSEELNGNFAAYAAEGHDGNETIYVNREWLDLAPSAWIKSVLLEEIGHAIDTRINGTRDSKGDEGQLFAAKALNWDLAETTQLDIREENDFSQLTIEGRTVDVQNASFTAENAYRIEIVAEDNQLGEIDKETNRARINYSAGSQARFQSQLTKIACDSAEMTLLSRRQGLTTEW